MQHLRRRAYENMSQSFLLSDAERMNLLNAWIAEQFHLS
jgi:hypothetical protein